MEEKMLKFAEEQIDGPYRYPEFRKAVNSLGDRRGDIVRLRRWESAADGSRKIDVTSPTSLMYSEAVECVGNVVENFAETEWSGANPMTWIVLRKAIIGANRLSTVPDQYIGPDISLREAMLIVCFLLDCMGRMSDKRERPKLIRELARGIDDEFMLKRALPIYMDIVCGRGGAWLNYIDDMGCVAMQGRQGSWWELRDTAAKQGLDRYVDLSAHILGVSDTEATRFQVGHFTLVGDYYDRWQYTIRRDAEGPRKADTFADEDVFRRCRVDGENPFVQDKSMDMFGYCRAFGTSPVACIFDIPRSLEIEVRKERIKKIATARKAAQEKAKKKFRLPRM